MTRSALCRVNAEGDQVISEIHADSGRPSDPTGIMNTLTWFRPEPVYLGAGWQCRLALEACPARLCGNEGCMLQHGRTTSARHSQSRVQYERSGLVKEAQVPRSSHTKLELVVAKIRCKPGCRAVRFSDYQKPGYGIGVDIGLQPTPDQDCSSAVVLHSEHLRDPIRLESSNPVCTLRSSDPPVKLSQL